MIYFDFRKSYILTSGSLHNFGGVVFAEFVKWSKDFIEILRRFGGVEEILEVQKKRPLTNCRVQLPNNPNSIQFTDFLLLSC